MTGSYSVLKYAWFSSWAQQFVSNHTHYSSTDPDARLSVKPGKPRQVNYLASVEGDTAHYVITQIESDYLNKKIASACTHY